MQLLQGGIDIHAHAGPSVAPRKVDDLELAKQAKEAGFKGITLKAHEGCSSGRAYLAGQVAGIDVLGGLCLNYATGGLNPEAVEYSLKMGSRIIWLPTLSARNHIDFFASPQGAELGFSLKGKGPGITIFEENKKIKKEVHQILELVKQHDVALATGHLGIEELKALVDLAIDEIKLEKLIINHPDINFISLPLDIQQELAKKGAYMEKCYGCLLLPWSVQTMEECAHMIKQIGPGACVISSDLGQPQNPSHPEGMKAFVKGLMDQGLTEKDIEIMWIKNTNSLMY